MGTDLPMFFEGRDVSEKLSSRVWNKSILECLMNCWLLFQSRLPPENYHDWLEKHEWGCISYWTWGIFQPVILVFWGVFHLMFRSKIPRESCWISKESPAWHGTPPAVGGVRTPRFLWRGARRKTVVIIEGSLNRNFRQYGQLKSRVE